MQCSDEASPAQFWRQVRTSPEAGGAADLCSDAVVPVNESFPVGDGQRFPPLDAHHELKSKLAAHDIVVYTTATAIERTQRVRELRSAHHEHFGYAPLGTSILIAL